MGFEESVGIEDFSGDLDRLALLGRMDAQATEFFGTDDWDRGLVKWDVSPSSRDSWALRGSCVYHRWED